MLLKVVAYFALTVAAYPCSGSQFIFHINSLHFDTSLHLINSFDKCCKQTSESCRNIPVLVDGAHALGQAPVDLQKLGADYYTSNCHKWFCSPKGAAFLHVRKERQHRLRPLITSHGRDSGFSSQFIWAGELCACVIMTAKVLAQYNTPLSFVHCTISLKTGHKKKKKNT